MSAKTDVVKNLAKNIASTEVRPSFLETLKSHINKRDFAALTGGIAIADATVRGTVAKKGERGKAIARGLGEGALYGATLSAAEPAIKAGLEYKGWLK